MKMLKISLMVFVLLTFQACSKVEYVEVPKPYAVPVPCTTPDVNCSVSGSDANVVVELVKCVVDLKLANGVCKNGKRNSGRL